MEEGKRGRGESWKSGRLEGWKSGRGKGWKNGGLEEWKVFPVFKIHGLRTEKSGIISNMGFVLF